MLPAVNRSAVVVTPKQPFVDWLMAADPTSADIAPDRICVPAIYLLPGCEDDKELERHVRAASKVIFEEQLDSWYRVRTRWPAVRDFKTFCLWFDYRTDALLLDLCDEPLRHD